MRAGALTNSSLSSPPGVLDWLHSLAVDLGWKLTNNTERLSVDAASSAHRAKKNYGKVGYFTGVGDTKFWIDHAVSLKFWVAFSTKLTNKTSETHAKTNL